MDRDTEIAIESMRELIGIHYEETGRLRKELSRQGEEIKRMKRALSDIGTNLIERGFGENQ